MKKLNLKPINKIWFIMIDEIFALLTASLWSITSPLFTSAVARI